MVFWLPALITSNAQVTIDAGNLRLDLNRDGTIDKVQIGSHELSIQKGESLFKVKDIKRKDGFIPVIGRIIKSRNDYLLEGKMEGLQLSTRIRFKSESGILYVNIEIENEAKYDRGLIISTMIDFKGNDYLWEGGLYNHVYPQKNKLYGNNLYPITTLTDRLNEWSLAFAIPPDSPVFYNTHYENGEFGLLNFIGLTPKTRNFPNRAILNEMLYSVSPNWGFRSALGKYYSTFGKFYEPRIKEVGLWGGWDYMKSYPYPKDIEFYEAGGFSDSDSAHGISLDSTIEGWQRQNHFEEIEKLNPFIFPYTIEGQRQIYDLEDTTLPYDKNREVNQTSEYERAMKLLKDWNVKKIVKFQDPNSANSFNSVKQLKAIIYNSGLYDSEGHYVVIARRYTGNTLTFPLNPNPELYDDSSKMTIAKYTLYDYIPRFIHAIPDISGIYFDSMGRWGKYLNYRQEHFKYTRYPLSVDSNGNPVIANVTSLYEFISKARTLLHAENKLIFANGVHEGGAKMPDGVRDYDAKNGSSRFFIAALCDIASCESGAKTPMKRMILYRTFVGKKPYAVFAYQHEGKDEIEKYFNRALVMDVLPSLSYKYYNSTDSINTEILHQKYLPLFKLLFHAGWEPVTGVSGGNGTYCERYGDLKKGTVYLVIYNDSEKADSLQLALDSKVFRKEPSNVVNLFRNNRSYPIRNGEIKLVLGPGELDLLKFN
jgi:hypothetical protein